MLLGNVERDKEVIRNKDNKQDIVRHAKERFKIAPMQLDLHNVANETLKHNKIHLKLRRPPQLLHPTLAMQQTRISYQLS